MTMRKNKLGSRVARRTLSGRTGVFFNTYTLIQQTLFITCTNESKDDN